MNMSKDLETNEASYVESTDELDLEEGLLTEVCASEATARTYGGGFFVMESFGY